MTNAFDTSREPKLEDFAVRSVPTPEKPPISECHVNPNNYWYKNDSSTIGFIVGTIVGLLVLILCIVVNKNGLQFGYILGSLVYAGIGYVIGWIIHSIGQKVVKKRLLIENQEEKYKLAMQAYNDLLAKAEQDRIDEFNAAHKAWEERQEKLKREQAERIMIQQKDKEIKARIEKEEAEADTKMSNSGLVVEIAKCILPFFKRIIDQADRESHMKVRVRLGIKVNKDSIEYYDVSIPQNVSMFSFSEEGISDRLSPIYRKALCKALVTELRRLLFETYSTDSSGQKIQIGLEGAVTLVSQIKYIPGRDYTAPEYDDKSFATAVLLYETFEQKAERHF